MVELAATLIVIIILAPIVIGVIAWSIWFLFWAGSELKAGARRPSGPEIGTYKHWLKNRDPKEPMEKW